jgi:hypothetical protein
LFALLWILSVYNLSTYQVAKKRRKREPAEEIHVAWKGGLAQQRAAVEAAQRAAMEAGKAFGR